MKETCFREELEIALDKLSSIPLHVWLVLIGVVGIVVGVMSVLI